MKWKLVLLLLLVWLSSGIFIVSENEQALLRRFGRFVRDANGAPRFYGAGMHFDVPFPGKTVNRLNFHEVHLLKIGVVSDLTLSQPGPNSQGRKFHIGNLVGVWSSGNSRSLFDRGSQPITWHIFCSIPNF